MPTGRDYVRMKVRERDDFTCQDCRARRTPEEVELCNARFARGLKGRIKQFDVHHLNGLCGKRTRAYDKMSDMPGLITLCHKCHHRRHDHSQSHRRRSKYHLDWGTSHVTHKELFRQYLSSKL